VVHVLTDELNVTVQFVALGHV